MSDQPYAPRLMLILPSRTPPTEAQAMARAGDVAAVILRLEGEPVQADLSALAAPLQRAGAAVLVEGRADLAKPLGLDGAHLAGMGALKAGLPALKPAMIAGAGALSTRHDAMEAGEAGADYVLFGGDGTPFAQVCEQVAWWAELFEVPCVGVAATPEEAVALARAGADFVALTGALLSSGAIAALAAQVSGETAGA